MNLNVPWSAVDIRKSQDLCFFGGNPRQNTQCQDFSQSDSVLCMGWGPDPSSQGAHTLLVSLERSIIPSPILF